MVRFTCFTSATRRRKKNKKKKNRKRNKKRNKTNQRARTTDKCNSPPPLPPPLHSSTPTTMNNKQTRPQEAGERREAMCRDECVAPRVETLAEFSVRCYRGVFDSSMSSSTTARTNTRITRRRGDEGERERNKTRSIVETLGRGEGERRKGIRDTRDERGV